jgi:hypothetical protein
MGDDMGSNKAVNLRLLSTFLNEIDGIGKAKGGTSSLGDSGGNDDMDEETGVLVIVACMNIDKVMNDSALSKLSPSYSVILITFLDVMNYDVIVG